MFEKIKGFIMSVLSFFHTQTVDEVTGIKTNISTEMYDKIELWASMLSGHAPWSGEAKPCGILPQIAGRLNYFVSREIGLQVENDAIRKPMEHLNKNVDKVVEYIALMGGAVLRPIYSQNKLQYEIIPLGNYLPTQYDFDGTLTAAIILKNIEDAGKKFLLMESHNYDGINHSVKLRLYRNNDGTLREVGLTSCTQTAELTPEYTWENCGRPMIVEFRNHSVNKIDGSNIPVALIDDAIDLIEKADRQFARMDWEQEAGEKRVFADKDLFTKKIRRNGETVEVSMTKKLEKLVTKIDGDGSAQGEKIHEYSPELRTEAQNAYLQQIFRRIELTLNVGKGTVSDAEAVSQTATQYSGGRQELFAIVDKIEDEIAAKYEETALIFAYMAAAYGIKGAPARDPKPEELYTIKWCDDQTRKDIQQAKQTAMN